MSARKKKTSRARSRARQTIDGGLRDLEKRLPKNLRGPMRDLRANLRALQKQVDRMRHEREERWRRLEAQVRRDTASLLRRLEKAVVGSSKKTSRAKSGSKKKSAARKKSGARKKAGARKKPARRKTTRKKTTRKKTTRR